MEGLLYGAVVGLSLGLTGGGGALFAVPLLVYGLHLPMREAASVSLAAVGTVSLVGAWQRWVAGQVDVATGLIFALGGAVGAPVGVRIAKALPESVLLPMFAGLMLLVASKMWLEAGASPKTRSAETGVDAGVAGVRVLVEASPSGGERVEQGAARGRALRLVPLGLVCGVLSGMFGVGGGFIIVPSLVLFANTPMMLAVGTSLMVITLVSASGVVSHLMIGSEVPFLVTALFVVGGVGGLQVGQRIGARLAPGVLQRVFVIVLLGVAGLVLVRPPASLPAAGASSAGASSASAASAGASSASASSAGASSASAAGARP